MDSNGKIVCVVGAGMLGLLAMKNLKEQGLSVVAFTKDDYIGGLWHTSQDTSKTTALPQTTANTSKQTNCFTDFPMPDEYSMHPPSKDIAAYLEAYAERFDLAKDIRCGYEVISVERDSRDENWLVTTRKLSTGDTATIAVGRVVVASGILNTKHEVHLKHEERFKGELIHSREFKDPAKYKGKRVMVVGIGSTGADTLVFLRQANVGKLYASHREQFWVLPRVVDGVAFDHSMSRRAMIIIRWIASCSTSLCFFIMAKALLAAQRKAFPFLKDHPSFAFNRKAPHPLYRLPMFSDYLAQYLGDGDIEAVQGIKEITGPNSVLLTDGKTIDNLDAIIICSGYDYDLSVVKGQANPTNHKFAPDGFQRLRDAKYGSPEAEFPRLYHGFLSEQYPESLAFLGHLLIPMGPMALYDLVTMALASLWSGEHPLPAKEEMASDINKHYDFVCKSLAYGAMPHFGFRMDCTSTYHYLHDAAATGLNERLGSWNWQAWKFWWSDSKFYKMLMDGPDVPAVNRLFDTGRGRKPWPGAREHIEKTNAEVRMLADNWKKKNQKAKAA